MSSMLYLMNIENKDTLIKDRKIRNNPVFYITTGEDVRFLFYSSQVSSDVPK